MSDETPIERAERAVCDQIAQRVASHAPDEQRAGELKKLAEGVAAMKHGPQGGAYNYAGTYASDTHSTDHEGEQRDRPQTGFGGD